MNLITSDHRVGDREIASAVVDTIGAVGAWELTVIRPPAQIERLECSVVRFVVNRDPVQSFLERIVEALVPLGQFFRQRHRLWCRTPAGPTQATARSLPGLLVGCVELLMLKETPEGTKIIGYRVLSTKLARALLLSPALHRLPEFTEPPSALGVSSAVSELRPERQLEPLIPLAAQFAGIGPAPATVWVERLESAGLHHLVAGPLGERSPRGKATRLGRFFGSLLGVPFGSGETQYELLRHYPRGIQGKPVYEIGVCTTTRGRRSLDDV